MKTTYFIALLLLVRVVCAQPKDCRIADILFVTDWSASMSGNEHFISEAFEAILDTIDLSEDGVKIGFISFNSETYINSHITSNTQSLYDIAGELRNKRVSGSTQASQSLLFSDSLFFKSESERGYRPMRILVFISDGMIDDHDASLDLFCYLKQQGIIVIGVQITDGYYTDESYFKKFFVPIVSGERFYFPSDYERLRETLLQINFCL
jgi:Mg-chelatase subunit ChlD